MSKNTQNIDPGDDDLMQADFGYRKVALGEKAGLVRDVFNSVAGRYDLMNDLMSAGVHRLWKAELVRQLNPRPGETIIDVGGGTGDIAFRILGAGGDKVVISDINDEMLSAGRDRALDRGHVSGVEWISGDAEQLPFADGFADVYVTAFCLRNVSRLNVALIEAARVLRPGGRFFCLEFSHIAIPALGALYDSYSFNVLPLLGRMVAGDEDAYRYLAESIRRFPDQDEFAALIDSAGLHGGGYRNLSAGIAAIHWARRI
ncbi:MAG: class I SAM-dependent methyltransferase [Rhodospirillales bacterium]|nr:class I SAM-dependent methyltransferase [Rhodospirillales bacterium]